MPSITSDNFLLFEPYDQVIQRLLHRRAAHGAAQDVGYFSVHRCVMRFGSSFDFLVEGRRKTQNKLDLLSMIHGASFSYNLRANEYSRWECKELITKVMAL